MSVERVRSYLSPFGLESRVLAFAASSATVEEAAAAVGCPPAQIAKTMAFLLDGQPILVVLAGDTKIDNGKYKSRFHQKAVMAPLAQVETLVGYAAGGVCPFDLREGVPVYLDEALRRFDFVYPAGGDDHSAVKLTPAELESVAKAMAWVDVGKPAG